MVIVEDVLDEDEDDDDVAVPTLAARTPSPSPAPQMLGSVAAGTPLCVSVGVEMGAPKMCAVSMGRSSSLSPLTTPFFLAKPSTGRSKTLQWMEDSGDSDSDYTSSAAQSSYLDATHQAIEVMASPAPTAPCEGESSALRPIIITKKRRHRRRRRARTGDVDGPPAMPPLPDTRVPTHQRLGPQPVARVPVHQRIGS